MRKLIFKFFMWRINVEINRLDGEERIKFLVEELVKALFKNGHNLMHRNISEGFGSCTIFLHNMDTDHPTLDIEDAINGWAVKTTPNFGLQEVTKWME